MSSPRAVPRPAGASTLDEVIATLVVGARQTGMADLLSRIPARPADGTLCPRCEGDRWDNLLRAHGVEITCTLCCGRGLATADMLANAQARWGAR